jgi:hypothetical protein
MTTTSAPPTRSFESTTTSVVANVPVAESYFNGLLTLAAPDAIIPLQGPGQWALRVTHAVNTILQCGSRSAALTSTVLIGGSQNCSLDINIATGAPTTWILSAAR